MKLIPVDHDPFAEDQSFKAADELVHRVSTFADETRAEIAAVARELHGKIDAVRTIAGELNSIARELHNAVMPALAREIENAKHLEGTDKTTDAKLAGLTKEVLGKSLKLLIDREPGEPAEPTPIEILRDKRGEAVKVVKGDRLYNIERASDRVIRIVPEGEPKPPRSSKRFDDKPAKPKKDKS
jgi:hypothetical protein